MRRSILFVLSIVVLVASACQPPVEESQILVSLIMDGRERTFQYSMPVTVEEFLRDVEAELGSSDRLSVPLYTQINDGMRITVVRVTERVDCETETIPYESRIVLNEGLRPGEEQLAQAGQTGTQEVCYRTIIEDGVERSRTRIGQPTVIMEPRAEIRFVGPSEVADPVPVVGTLAYISNGNAWSMRGSSTTKRPLTTTGNVDSLVFSLSPDGRYLLYTARSEQEEGFFNRLWLIQTSGDFPPVLLDPADVLYASWVPLRENTISYSTGEARPTAPFWRALNNLWTMRIDPATGQALNVTNVVRESLGGLYGWWGTIFEWSPDGQQLAWVRADSMGLVDLASGDLRPLVQYAVFNTSQPWSWRATVSWSWDAGLIATTVHGPPIGNEPAENSPVFNVVVTDTGGSFVATLADSAGMWASPRFSPQLEIPGSQFPRGYLAYLRAREPYNSISGQYDLVVSDRDGSNTRVIFPRSDQPGITTRAFGLAAQDFSWSPDGRQIAFIYQGNLWIIDVETVVSHQLTFDGGASHPVWAP